MIRQLLVFPVLVVVLAFASFAVGGHCAAWQWWLAAALAIAAGFWGRTAREGVRGGLLFLLWMAIVWVGCGLAVAPNWFDESCYHIPAVRMLADGWNPLYVSTPEKLLRTTGFKAVDFRVDHVLFMPKIVWVFSAVAYFFTNDLLNPLEPILWFLLPVVLMRIWRTMEGAGTVWKILAVPLLYCLLMNSAYVVDAVVQLAAIGLLLTFEETLSRRRTNVLSLVVFSFWMMGSKTTGFLHGGFFWAIFLVFAFAGKVKANWRPLAASVGAVALLLALVCSTPYLTSIRHYGHPFYPNYTFDEARFPVRDITDDFITGQNADAARMGFFGRCVNSFVSPSLARAWYRWRLQKPDFSPHSNNYWHYPTDGDGSSPTRFGMRVALWASVALLLIAGRKSFRPLVLMTVLGMCAAPLPVIGYIRYVPWWLLPVLLLYIDLACGGVALRRALACALLIGVFSIRPYTLAIRVGHTVTLVEERRQLRELLADGRELPPIRPCLIWSRGQLKMMRREFPSIGKAEMLPYSVSLERKLKEAKLSLPGSLFVFDDVDEMRRHAHVVPKGTWPRIRYVMRAVFRTLPLEVVHRIGSLFGNARMGRI